MNPNTAYKYGVTTTSSQSTWYTDPPQGGSSTTSSEAIAERQRLQCAAMNPGDKVNPTPWSFNKETLRYPRGVIRSTNKSFPGGSVQFSTVTRSGVLSDYSLQRALDPSDANVAYSAALKKLYDKIRQSNANLAVDGAEWRQTAKMLATAVEAVRSPLKFFGREVRELARSRTWKRKLNGPASAWLQYTYGWAPLAGSITDLINIAYREAYKPLTIVGKGMNGRETSRILSSPIYDGTRTYAWKGTHVTRKRIQATYMISNPDLVHLSSITTLNPALIAWELVPFSFVGDWFIDISGYLELLEASWGYGLTLKNVGISTLVVETSSGHVGESYTVSGTYSSGFARYSAEVTNFNRTVQYSWPKPIVPSFRIDLGWRRLLSAGALIHQLLR